MPDNGASDNPAGERQTEPHQPTYEAAMAEWDRNAAGWEKARAELARVRAERDLFASNTEQWMNQAKVAEAERDEARAAHAREVFDHSETMTRAENQVAEIVALIRSYADVHMTKALADLIEHKYVGRPPQS